VLPTELYLSLLAVFPKTTEANLVLFCQGWLSVGVLFFLEGGKNIKYHSAFSSGELKV